MHILSTIQTHPFCRRFHYPFLGCQAGVDIEIKGRGDGRMAEDFGDGFVVAAAFYATCGEGVAKGVEPDRRETELGEQTMIVGAVRSGLKRLGPVGKQVMVGRSSPMERTYDAQQLARQRYLPNGRWGLGRVDREVVPLAGAVGKVDALDCFPDAKGARAHIDVLPLQAALRSEGPCACR